MRISDWSSDVCSSDLIPATELDKEPYVNRSNCEVFELVQKELDRRGISLRKVFSSPRDDWVQGMVKAGLGYGFFPKFSVTDPDLVVRPLVNPSFNRTIYLTTVRGRPHSPARSEEHTSELQSLMRISYAVFCLKKKTHNYTQT